MRARRPQEHIGASMPGTAVLCARDLWLRRRDAIVAAYGGLGRFQAIVDEEYERSIRDTSPEPAPEASGGEASGRMPE
jgi:hypothetical protein